MGGSLRTDSFKVLGNFLVPELCQCLGNEPHKPEVNSRRPSTPGGLSGMLQVAAVYNHPEVDRTYVLYKEDILAHSDIPFYLTPGWLSVQADDDLDMASDRPA